MKRAERPTILGLEFDDVDIDAGLDAVLKAARERRAFIVRVGNVHMCMEAFDDPDLRRILNNFDLALVDSKVLSWAQQLAGFRAARGPLHGAVLMAKLCETAAKEGIVVGLYGGTPDTRDALATKLPVRFPKLKIGAAISPPFRPLRTDETTAHVNALKRGGVEMLMVGLGCPKQERWMAAHRERLDCPMVGLGAAFDILAGVRRASPSWVHRSGLEWAWRTVTEPRRILPRTLKHNPRFLLHFSRELVGRHRRQ